MINRGLCINENNIKFIILSRIESTPINLKVGNLNFKYVDNFKYLGVNINNIHRKINETILNGNKIIVIIT